MRTWNCEFRNRWVAAVLAVSLPVLTFAILLADDRQLATEDIVPTDTVLVELHEGLPADDSWKFALPEVSERYTQPAFAFVGFPKKYTPTGVIGDRTNPFLFRARLRLIVTETMAGDYECLLRAKGAAKLFLDGQFVAETAFLDRNSDGHEAVPELSQAARDDLRPLPPGCQEQLAKLTLAPGEHIVQLEAIVGGKGLRLELDELCVGLLKPSGEWQLLTAGPPIPLTEDAWQRHAESQRTRLADLDRTNRREASREWTAYWHRRHEHARQIVQKSTGPAVPEVPADVPVQNDVDRFVAARTPVVDDLAFLRRVTLDTVGVVPSREEITQFLAYSREDRRANVIDRLLDDPRFAGHWVSYWQDVLAENPGILKPELNNTGPFRWWIYESLQDNKPLDQFATELAMMEGSVYYGGPAGFGLATQNDVPSAAKAHVLAKAFLAMDLTCARCHDAPYHPFKQEQLFSLAAMLHRKPIELPKTSTVPTSPGGRQPVVTISLTPGQKIDPAWLFDSSGEEILPPDLLRHPDDSRERLAVLLTSPNNSRFSQVLANRVWQRYFGRALIEPVDDWEAGGQQPSPPELLKFLARELAGHDYDLKHLSRLILNSRAYQLATTDETLSRRRRLTAEQLVDSLFAMAGKRFDTEPLTMDPEGRRPVETFLNLGTPGRAWQLTSLSNERDRPALALPVSQSFVDLLVAFGWRDSRQNPLTLRETDPTPLQPLTLANGVVGNRAIRLSDDSAWTALCLEDQPMESLVDEVFLRTLTRHPADEEREMGVSLLSDGYSSRVVPESDSPKKPRRSRNAVSWSNHLSAEATKIKQDLERQVQAGDPPTPRLQSGWRERMEDLLWALVNSPEFVFVP